MRSRRATARHRHAPSSAAAATCLALAAGGVALTAGTAAAQVPTPQSPACGSRLESLQAVLVAENAPGGPFAYDFAVYSDPAAMIAYARTNPLVPEGAGATTSWPVPLNFLENGRYYWRVRVQDGSGFGPWSAPLCSFFVNTINEAPGIPRINSPAFGGPVNSVTPTLVVDNAIDPDGDTLRYLFEGYSDPALSQHVWTSAPIPEGAAGTTSSVVNNANPALMEDRFYYWRARACDPDNLCSGWSATGQFFVSLTNSPPEPPSIISPQNGTIVPLLRPNLAITNADDSDLDPLVYDWDLARDVQFANLVARGINEPPSGAQTTTFQLAADLEEDTRYCWRVRSDDGQATSTYNIACFLVSVTDDPPSIPVPLRPAQGLVIVTTTPVFSWEPSTDPEGQAVTYEVEVAQQNGDVFDRVVGVAGTVTSIAHELEDGATYTWRVRAIDPALGKSDFSPAHSFTVEAPQDDLDGCCTADGGCRIATSGEPGSLAGVGLAFGLLLRRRRRR